MTASERPSGIASVEEAASVLGVGHDAGEEQLRAAYLERVRQHPPDADPEGFERVRDAYAMLRDPHRKAGSWLDVDPDAPLTELLEQPCFVGPEPWLEAIRRMVRP